MYKLKSWIQKYQPAKKALDGIFDYWTFFFFWSMTISDWVTAGALQELKGHNTILVTVKSWLMLIETMNFRFNPWNSYIACNSSHLMLSNMHLFCFNVFNRKRNSDTIQPTNPPEKIQYHMHYCLTCNTLKMHYKLPLKKEFDKVVLN